MSVILRFQRWLGFLKFVFQWPARSEQDIDADDPKATLEKTMCLIQGKYDLKAELLVGYRNFAGDDYTPDFPPGLSVFRVA